MSWWPCEDVIGKGTSKDKLFKQVPWKNWAWWRPSVRVKGRNLVLLVWFAATSWCFSYVFMQYVYFQPAKKEEWMASSQHTLNIYIYTHIYIYETTFSIHLFCWERWDAMNRSDPQHHIVQITGTSCRLAAMMQKAWHPPHFRLGKGW